MARVMTDAPEQQLNADFTARAEADTAAMRWQASPSPTVWRKRLELSGPAEAGRVTSVVRYDPDSAFPTHAHPDGEEILVLEGTFSDEHGDYPAGTFLLNPEGFCHAPFSRQGCTLLVKLRQYPGADREHITIDTNRAAWRPGNYPGTEILPLYESDRHPERILLFRAKAGCAVPEHDHPAGEEFFVLEGSLEDEHGVYRAGHWVRSPPGSRHTARSRDGVLAYVKLGHLGG